MVDDKYLKQIQRFVETAVGDRPFWQAIVGQRIEHKLFGSGVISKIDSGSENIYLEVVFDKLPPPESRKTFGAVALTKGIITGVDLSSLTFPENSVAGGHGDNSKSVRAETPLGSGTDVIRPYTILKSREEEKFWEMVGEKTHSGALLKMLIARFKSLPNIRVEFEKTAYRVILHSLDGSYYSLFHMNRKGEINVWIRVLRGQFMKAGLDTDCLERYIREMRKILRMPEGRDELTFDVDFVDMDKFLESVDRFVAELRSKGAGPKTPTGTPMGSGLAL